MERVAVQKRTMIGKAARCAGLCGVLALVGLVAAAAPASAARPASPAPKLQQAMEELVAAGVPGVVVLIREGDRTIRLSSGYGNLATKAPLRPTDRFRIASLTKTFVATVVLQLVEEGKLSLEDTVERWLPGVVPNGENITVRELLAHKSGLFDYSQDPRVLKPYLSGNLSYYWAPRRLVQIAVSHRPLFAPGTAVSYSSTGYVLLGLIVRAATGNPIGTELNRRLFKPLGLHATTFSTSGHIAGAHAHGYFVVPNRPLQDVTGSARPGTGRRATSSPPPTTSPASTARCSPAGCSAAPCCGRWRRPRPTATASAGDSESPPVACHAARSGAMTAPYPATTASPTTARMAVGRSSSGPTLSPRPTRSAANEPNRRSAGW
jgi:CubicO group peptidase (beta-lactamase class C family)